MKLQVTSNDDGRTIGTSVMASPSDGWIFTAVGDVSVSTPKGGRAEFTFAVPDGSAKSGSIEYKADGPSGSKHVYATLHVNGDHTTVIIHSPADARFFGVKTGNGVLTESAATKELAALVETQQREEQQQRTQRESELEQAKADGKVAGVEEGKASRDDEVNGLKGQITELEQKVEELTPDEGDGDGDGDDTDGDGDGDGDGDDTK